MTQMTQLFSQKLNKLAEDVRASCECKELQHIAHLFRCARLMSLHIDPYCARTDFSSWGWDSDDDDESGNAKSQSIASCWLEIEMDLGFTFALSGSRSCKQARHTMSAYWDGPDGKKSFEAWIEATQGICLGCLHFKQHGDPLRASSLHQGCLLTKFCCA